MYWPALSRCVLKMSCRQTFACLRSIWPAAQDTKVTKCTCKCCSSRLQLAGSPRRKTGGSEAPSRKQREENQRGPNTASNPASSTDADIGTISTNETRQCPRGTGISAPRSAGGGATKGNACRGSTSGAARPPATGNPQAALHVASGAPQKQEHSPTRVSVVPFGWQWKARGAGTGR